MASESVKEDETQERDGTSGIVPTSSPCVPYPLWQIQGGLFQFEIRRQTT